MRKKHSFRQITSKNLLITYRRKSDNHRIFISQRGDWNLIDEIVIDITSIPRLIETLHKYSYGEIKKQNIFEKIINYLKGLI